MALTPFKFPIHDADFPFVSTMNQRSVQVGQLDPAGHMPRSFYGAEDNADYNTAQILYAENVVPVAYGLRSCSYLQTVPPVTTAATFDRMWSLRDANENVSLFAPADGMNYVYLYNSSIWIPFVLPVGGYSHSPSAGNVGDLVTGTGLNTPETATVTTAYVDGKTFICYSRMKITNGSVTLDASLWAWPDDPYAFPGLKIVDSANLMTAPPLSTMPKSTAIVNLPTGFAYNIDGIASVQGYLVIWSGLQIAWAPYNGTAFDFASYANGSATGAGSQTPEDLDGPITAVVKVPGGMIIFTARNAVAAIYSSSNYQQPWIFRQITGAGGVRSLDQVSTVGSTAAVYAYTSNGLQLINLNSAKSVFPACTDFLGGHVVEEYDFVNHVINQSEVADEFQVKVRFVGNRFLCISYGTYPGIYSFALIYDEVLERWGKLRKKHADLFGFATGTHTVDITYGMLIDVTYNDLANTAYQDLTIQGSPVTYPRQLLSVVDVDGTVSLVVMDNRSMDTYGSAVVVLGEIQLVRSRQIEFHQVESEGCINVNMFVSPTYQDGSTLSATQLIPTFANGDYKEFATLQEARSFKLQIEGSFNLSTVICKCANGGQI